MLYNLDRRKFFIQKSKYNKTAYIFDAEDAALDFILKKYHTAMEKIAIFPYSDGTAYALDMWLDEFKSVFYVLSINGEQGRICSFNG